MLSGDAVPFTPAKTIKKNILSSVKPGALIIMHFNHPEWNSYEALKQVVPSLRKKGYVFARLSNFSLKGRS